MKTRNNIISQVREKKQTTKWMTLSDSLFESKENVILF